MNHQFQAPLPEARYRPQEESQPQIKESWFYCGPKRSRMKTLEMIAIQMDFTRADNPGLLAHNRCLKIATKIKTTQLHSLKLNGDLSSTGFQGSLSPPALSFSF